MKKLLLTLTLMGAALGAMAHDFTVGLIDTNAVLNSMPELKDVEQQINTAQNKYFNELKVITDEFQRQYEEYNALPDSEDSIIKQRRAGLLQETQQKRDAFERQVIAELESLQYTLMQPLYEKIQAAVTEIGKDNSFDMIMENGSDAKIYYYSKNVVDITPFVKAKLGVE